MFKVNKLQTALNVALGLTLPTMALAEKDNVTLEPITVVEQDIETQEMPGKTTTFVSDPRYTLRELFSQTPGVDFVNNGDGGISNINIRGLGGTPDLYGQNSGRVQITLDDIILPESFRFGHGAKAHGIGYFDSSTLASVTVERGPTLGNTASGVGGVVSLRTREPEDVLLPERQIGGQALAGYDGRYNAKYFTFAGAGKSKQGSVLVQYTRREVQEAKFDSMRTETILDQEGNWDYFLDDLLLSGYDIENMTQQELDDEYELLYDNAPKYDTYKTVSKNIADKFQVNSYSFLNKWNWDINDKHRVSFILDRFHSNNVKPIQITNDTLSQKSTYKDDSTYMSRLTLSLKGSHQWQSFATDRINWTLSRMKTEQSHHNFTEEKTLGTSNYSSVRSLNTYETKTDIAQLNFAKQFDLGKLNNQLNYGVNYRNSELTNLITNQTELFINQQHTNRSNTYSYFPYSKRIEKSVFVSNRWQYEDLPLSLTPMLKYTKLNEHSYKGSDFALATGSVGDTYYSDNIKKFKAWDYGLTLGWQANESHYFSLAYTQAHRFPGYAEMNPSTYYHNAFRPNPDLRPEKSNGFSLGWTFKGGWYRQTIELAHTNVKNKLEVFRHNCITASNCEYANLTNLADPVVIRSIEYTGEIDFGQITPYLNGLNLVAVLSYAKGKDKSIDKPVNSIAPLNGHATLAYKRSYMNTFARVNFSKAKKAKDIGQYDNAVGGTPPPLAGWATVDLGLGFSFNNQANLNFVIYNLFDKQYQRWENINYENADFRDQLWEPGRGVGVSFDVKF